MRYSELNEIAKRYGWIKKRDDEFWLLFTKNDINIEICKFNIHIIMLWAGSSDGEIYLNGELNFINACIELAETPLEDREDEKRFIIPLPELVTTDGKQQYLTKKGGYFFASRRDESLIQTWKEEQLKLIPEFYRQFAVEFDEEKEH